MLGRDQPAAAGAVLDHGDRAGVLGDLLREGAADLVDQAAGRGLHDDADRPVGIILRERGRFHATCAALSEAAASAHATVRIMMSPPV